MRASNKQTMYEVEIPCSFFSAVTPEPDSTEDSTGGLDPTDLPIVQGNLLRGIFNWLGCSLICSLCLLDTHRQQFQL